MNSPHDTESADRAAVVRMVYGYMGSQIIRTAVQLHIPDLVRDKTRDVGEIAEAVGAPRAPCRRLLNALVTLDLLVEPELGRYTLAPLGRFFTEDADHSLRMITRLFIGNEFWESWRHLTYSIETGRAAFDQVHGLSFYEYLGECNQYAEVFGAAMAENARFEAPRIASAHDFGRYRSIVDVGGGDGSLLAGILAGNPHVRGVVLETPGVAGQARALLGDLGLGGRCDVVEGDFFEGVPPRADAYVLKSVVHNWDDESCVRILRNCRAAMGEGSHLLLVEPVLPERTEVCAEMALESALSDLNMLVLTAGGFERTQDGFVSLLEASGLRLAEVSDRIGGTDFRMIRAVRV